MILDKELYEMNEIELSEIVISLEDKINIEYWKAIKMPNRSFLLLGELNASLLAAKTMIKWYKLKGCSVEVQSNRLLHYSHSIDSINDILNLNRIMEKHAHQDPELNIIRGRHNA